MVEFVEIKLRIEKGLLGLKTTAILLDCSDDLSEEFIEDVYDETGFDIDELKELSEVRITLDEIKKIKVGDTILTESLLSGRKYEVIIDHIKAVEVTEDGKTVVIVVGDKLPIEEVDSNGQA